jgi:hypothetical protein
VPEEQAQYAASDDFSFEHFGGLKMSGPLQDVDLPPLGTDVAILIFILQGHEDLTFDLVLTFTQGLPKAGFRSKLLPLKCA